jgi:hypothetical protein
MIRKLFSFGLFLILLNTFLYPSYLEASTAMDMDFVVVWDKKVNIVTGEYVQEVSMEIGKVTKYEIGYYEGILSENFSNKFEEGSNIYSMKGVSVDKSIAVQEKDGRYLKAVRKGEEKKEKNGNEYPIYILIAGGLLFFIILVSALYFLEKKVRKNH